jgi:restriction endonuclease S subunit
VFDCEALLIVGNGRWTGKVDYYKGKFEAYQRTYVLSDFKELNCKYLYHLLRNKMPEYLDKLKIGNAIPFIKLPMLQNFNLPIPSIKIQSEIVEELDGYQKIIDGCRQVIENYKPSIDIDPSWEMIEIKDAPFQIIDGDRGKNYPSGNDFISNGYCLFLNTKNVLKNGFNFDKTMFITKEKDNQLRKGKLARNDVILTTRGTIGNCAIFNDKVKFNNIRINSGMLIFKCNQEKLLPEYLFFYFQSNNFNQSIIQNKSRSAQPQLPISSLKNIKVPIPSISEQKKIITKIIIHLLAIVC